MTTNEASDIVQELAGLIHDELKVLSYKWVARQYAISANLAKRILFEFVEQQRDKVRTVYLVSGWTKSDPPSHVHKLVEAAQLQVCRENFSDVTGMHVYSVAPNQASNPDSIWQVTYQQSQQLLKEIMTGQPSASAEWFRSNGASAIRFTQVPPAGASRPPAAAVAEPAAPAAAGKVPAAPPAGQAGTPTIAKAKPAPVEEAPAAPSPGPASSPPKLAAASTPKPTGPSPPKPGAAPGAVGKGAVAKGAAAKGNTIANMFSKVSAKPKPPAEPPAVPAAAAPQAPAVAAAEAANDEEQEDDIRMAAGNGRARKRRGAQIDDSDDEGPAEEVAEVKEEQGQAAAAPAAAVDQPTGKGKAKSGTVKAEKAKAGGTKRAKTAAAQGPKPEAVQASQPEQEVGAPADNVDIDMDDAVAGALDAAAPALPPAEQPIAQAAPAIPATGGRGRKVTRTFINDDGEEVTEEVYEDGSAPLQQPAAAPAPQAAPAPAKGGGGGAVNKPAAKAAPAAAGKGKGKAPAAGQKSMTSFFAKK